MKFMKCELVAIIQYCIVKLKKTLKLKRPITFYFIIMFNALNQ